MKQISMALIITVFASCYGLTPEIKGMEGKPLPEFNFLLTDSMTWLNSRNIPAGKPTVLFYFSTTCPYCRAQTEEIVEDIDKLKDIQFYFITPSPLSGLKDFCKEFELSKYTNITSGVDTGSYVSNYFEIEGVPYMAVFDKNKTLKKSYLGKVYSSQLVKAVKE